MAATLFLVEELTGRQNMADPSSRRDMRRDLNRSRISVGSRPVSDPYSPLESIASGHEVEVGLTDFLPEGVSLASESAPETSSQDAAPTQTVVERPAVVDLEALTRIEAELGEVDAALVAIDENDIARSQLLGSLLAVPAQPSSSV